MSEITLQAIIDKIRKDLEWRGIVDNTRVLANIVFERSMAEALLRELEKLKGLE